jgi:hypothetical protein
MPDIKIEKLTQRQLEEFVQARRDIVAGRAALTPESFADALLAFATELTKQELEPDEFKAALNTYRQGVFELDQRSAEVSVHEEEGIRVRAAARCGWFGDALAEEDVGDFEPWRVSQIDDDIVAFYKKATTAPKN